MEKTPDELARETLDIAINLCGRRFKALRLNQALEASKEKGVTFETRMLCNLAAAEFIRGQQQVGALLYFEQALTCAIKAKLEDRVSEIKATITKVKKEINWHLPDHD